MVVQNSADRNALSCSGEPLIGLGIPEVSISTIHLMHVQLSLFPEFEQPSPNPRHRQPAPTRRHPTPTPINLAQLRKEIQAIATPMIETAVRDSYAQINRLLHSIHPYEYELIYDRTGSRSVLTEALKTAQQQLILVCPWPTTAGMTNSVFSQLEYLLEKGVCVKIGWGRLDDLPQGKTDRNFWYGALPQLRQLQRNYPENFQLKALGTHEKYLVCDRKFAMLISHNFLTSGVRSAEREIGLRTTDPRLIQDLINRFDSAENLEADSTCRGRIGWQFSSF
jgi:phosphatidylserine/phosphatidylglycerophosphate/cardiolipin synthase-like enzyme